MNPPPQANRLSFRPACRPLCCQDAYGGCVGAAHVLAGVSHAGTSHEHVYGAGDFVFAFAFGVLAYVHRCCLVNVRYPYVSMMDSFRFIVFFSGGRCLGIN